ncbi:hypothetical protein AWJ20_5028 [Sugiyamaella lignohabitans]|uniref:Uncharacterized protein n=1 Tax=Sugiyamaella lignohabitans TaxID=796027 RepID=A0A167EH14_9ASCO|nr:uncharacterized protein AWJ20_5028 [Sugiyamaella lignohabitans]ANB14072.1 hypothetical protein AWJ20_5028 [Sugiyamaella lignohabitans]
MDRAQYEAERFFYHSPVTLYSVSKLFNFNPDVDDEKVDVYRRSLMKILRKRYHVQDNSLTETLTIDQDIEWMTLPANSSLTLHFIFIHGVDMNRIHRVCLATDNDSNSGVLLTSCSHLMANLICEWIEKTFDCQIHPLPISDQFLLQQYKDYLSRSLENDAIADSQLIFSTPTAKPDLRTISVSLPGEDMSQIYRRIQDKDGSSIFNAILQYIHREANLDLNRFKLERVNCGGFVMTTTGKIKFFRQYYTFDQLIDLVFGLLQIALGKMI